MTKEQEDKIIAQANEILQRRSENTIYIEESGGGNGNVWMKVFIVLPNGEKAYYTREGEISRFSCGCSCAHSFQANELPKDLLFSFRHGTHSVEAKWELGDYKWNFDDLEYERIDEEKWNKEQQNIKSARELIDTCKTIDDIYTLYDKYLRNAHTPYDIIFKAFKILQYEPNLSDLFNGEIGKFGFEQSLVFFSIMKGYEETKKKNSEVK